jgi:hypothetical protein
MGGGCTRLRSNLPKTGVKGPQRYPACTRVGLAKVRWRVLCAAQSLAGGRTACPGWCPGGSNWGVQVQDGQSPIQPKERLRIGSGQEKRKGGLPKMEGSLHPWTQNNFSPSISLPVSFFFPVQTCQGIRQKNNRLVAGNLFTLRQLFALLHTSAGPHCSEIQFPSSLLSSLCIITYSRVAFVVASRCLLAKSFPLHFSCHCITIPTMGADM